MAAKVVIENAILRGSAQDEFLQTVATVYFDGDQEYKVLAPPKAQGPALGWIKHLSVRETDRTQFGSQLLVTDARAGAIIGHVAEELKRRDLDDEIWDPKDNLSGRYCPAQICVRGHLVHVNGGDVKSGEHCTECGELAIVSCERCGARIRGKEVYATRYERPSFCHKCGVPYPWMKDRLDTAKELLDHDDKLSFDDRKRLWGLLQYVMSDPKSDLAPAKKKLIEIDLAKAASSTREFFTDLLAKYLAEMSKP